MQIREGSKVQEISASQLAELTADSATVGGSLDLFPGDVNTAHYVLTGNLTSALAVGLNTRNARRGQIVRVTLNQAAPGAFTCTVKSGTAAGGTTLHRALASTRNGFVEAKFDGTNWVGIGFSEHT
jgi:hypothetical protein